MKRFLYISLACYCLLSMVGCDNTAIKDKTLLNIVKAGRDKNLTIVEFFESGDSVLMAVTLDAPYIPEGRMVGYEIQCNRRHRNHIVFLSALKDHPTPSFIVDTAQLVIQPDSIIQCYLDQHSVFGWGSIRVYQIQNDSMIYSYTEIIE